MTEEIKQQLVDIKILVEFKQRFTAPEQAFIYHVYNLITGEDKRPNGCPACLNSTISRLKKEIRLHGI